MTTARPAAVTPDAHADTRSNATCRLRATSTDETVISAIGGITTGVRSHHGGVRFRSDTTSTTAQVR